MTLHFDTKNIENFPKQLKNLIQQQETTLQQLFERNKYPTYHELVPILELQSNALHHLWSPIAHLHAVMNSDALRTCYEQCLPLLSAHHTWLSHYEPLFHAVEAIAHSENFAALTTAQKKYIKDSLRDFKLAGIALPPAKKKRFAEITLQLSELSNLFEQHLLDATDTWELHLPNKEALAGLPDTALELLATQAKAKQLPGFLISLQAPSYIAVITYADDRKLRQKIYEAYVTRASEIGPSAEKYDNGPIMLQILTLRAALAHLLGFSNYAEYALQTRMAQSPEEVNQFLEKLIALAKPFAEKEMLGLAEFAKQHLSISELQPWDVAYVSEKLKIQTLNFDDEVLRPYFPLPVVLKGLFHINEQLFHIHFAPAPELPTWHEDVQAYAILNTNKQPIAYFYFDLYARTKKRGGAWMDDAQSFWYDAQSGQQLPIAFLTCNFSPPQNGQAALLTHDEVVTLFHEFGHGLQHMLTEIHVLALTGINSVEWDAVELPSQLLENWCWQAECLNFLSSHVESKTPLPETLLTQLLSSKNFLSGLFLMRQLEFALFDLRLHWKFDAKKGYQQIQQILNQVRKEVTVTPLSPQNRFQHAFSHIFSGGYAAGYYSYLWAEVLAQDAFSFFEEQGILSSTAGQHFHKSLLSQGASKPAAELFREFRGRDPIIEPLLKNYGLI